MMRTIIFFFLLGAIGFSAWWYLEGGRLSLFENEDPYCTALKERGQDEEYVISYGERAKAVSLGCL